jgi:general secretion pathway protein B
MSLILDALRKADAQRERDPARGIHARPVQASSQLRRPADDQRRLWLWGAAAILGAGLLALAAWQLAGPATAPIAPITLPTPPAPVALSPAPAAPLALPAPPAASAAPANEVLPVAPPAPAVPPLRAATPAAPVAAAAPPVREAAKPAAAASTPASAAAARDRVLTVNELPADVQRDLPKLVISAGVYSDNPAQRLLIVNGQAVAEGAEPAPGVLLEQIRARTAVLKYRGYRYSMVY